MANVNKSNQQQQRVVWLGESPLSADSREVQRRLLDERIQQIETCDIAVLFDPGERDPSSCALAEMAYALKRGRQILYVDGDGALLGAPGLFALRAASHYVRLMDREKTETVARCIARHHCGHRIQAAFPEELLSVVDKAESPIEERLGIHLVTACDLQLRVQPQVPMTINGAAYRADFVVSDEDLGVRIVVEADGHDFHERTKEQATRDKRRDRAMLTDGFYVMRFTGQEIWADPNKCAEEVFDFGMERCRAAEEALG